jgi:hypothetical protein
MRIACTDVPACQQVRDMLRRHSITGSVRWESGSPIGTRIWAFVNVPVDLDKAAAIQRDITSIAGATLQE